MFHKKAFSLIELLLVLLIFSFIIVCIVSVFKIEDGPKFKTQLFVDKLNLFQKQVIISNKNTKLNFQKSNEYFIPYSDFVFTNNYNFGIIKVEKLSFFEKTFDEDSLWEYVVESDIVLDFDFNGDSDYFELEFESGTKLEKKLGIK